MNPYIAEFSGTMLLVLIGDGVCANASLSETKGNRRANWLQINVGWALAVFVGVLVSAESSGAHLNPAVTIGLAIAKPENFGWGEVLPYIVSQFFGACAGGILVYLFYAQHYAVTDDPDAKLGTFCTAPAIRGMGHNLFSEALGTFVLVFAVFMTAGATLEVQPGAEQPIGLGAIGAIPVALVVFAIGIALGGTTGYGINPVRDLGPRLVHAMLPIPGKRDSDWSYAWVPVVGPILGCVVAAVLFKAVSGM